MDGIVGLFHVWQRVILFSRYRIRMVSHVLIFPFRPVERKRGLPSHHRHIVFLGLVITRIEVGLEAFKITLQVHHDVVEGSDRLEGIQKRSIFLAFFIHPNSIMIFCPFQCSKKQICMRGRMCFAFLFFLGSIFIGNGNHFLLFLFFLLLYHVTLLFMIVTMFLIINDGFGLFLGLMHWNSCGCNLLSFTCNVRGDIAILMWVGMIFREILVNGIQFSFHLGFHISIKKRFFLFLGFCRQRLLGIYLSISDGLLHLLTFHGIGDVFHILASIAFQSIPFYGKLDILYTDST